MSDIKLNLTLRGIYFLISTDGEAETLRKVNADQIADHELAKLWIDAQHSLLAIGNYLSTNLPDYDDA